MKIESDGEVILKPVHQTHNYIKYEGTRHGKIFSIYLERHASINPHDNIRAIFRAEVEYAETPRDRFQQARNERKAQDDRHRLQFEADRADGYEYRRLMITATQQSLLQLEQLNANIQGLIETLTPAKRTRKRA